LYGAVKKSSQCARSDCPNKYVFSDRHSAFRKFDSKLFQTLVTAAAKVLSPKQLDVRWTVSVLSATCESYANGNGQIASRSAAVD